MERVLVPPTGTPSYLFPMAPPTSLRGVLLLALATARALLVLLRERPRVTVGTGGYVCAPAAVASWLMRVPVVLYLPDVRPGKAVARLLPLARHIAVSTEDSLDYLPAEKTVVTGYPVRDAFRVARREEGRKRLGIPANASVLFVTGGSLGARSINQALASCLPDLLAHHHVLHVCGRGRLAEAEAAASGLTVEQRARYHLFPYLEEEAMAGALAAANLALCRSGASSLGELPATGTPAVLVPLPIQGVNQGANADYLAQRGAAVVLPDDQLPHRLGPLLTELLNDPERLAAMSRAARALFRPDAADRIARLALVEASPVGSGAS